MNCAVPLWAKEGASVVQANDATVKWASIRWFSSVGGVSRRNDAERSAREFAARAGVKEVRLEWVTAAAVVDLVKQAGLTDSPLWAFLSGVPERIRQAADASGRFSALVGLLEDSAAEWFHAAFDGAYSAFAPYGDEAVSLAVGAALYFAALATAWEEAVGDAEPNPVQPAMDIFARGHWPVGMIGDCLYLV